MRCPKCGYISFDYNQICPKCDRDIGDEQKKLNLPAYKPEPPFLLGTLTGIASESQIELEADGFKDTSELEREIAASMDDTGVMKKEELFGGDDAGFEMQVDLEQSDSAASETDAVSEDLPAVDLSEIDGEMEFENGGKQLEELTLDLGDLSEERESTDADLDAQEKDIGTGTVVLEDLKMQDDDIKPDAAPDTEGGEAALDLDEVSDEGLEAAMALDKEDEELSLSLEEFAEDAEDLDELRLEPMEVYQGESIDLDDIDLGQDETKGAEADSAPFNESEMLTLELNSGKEEEASDGGSTDLKEDHEVSGKSNS